MHPTYRALILSRVHAAVAASKAIVGVKHNGLKGQLREILVRELFRPLLPLDVGLGTGELVSSAGQTSSQQDVVVFDRSILPPIVFESSNGLFPIEAVLYAIEVKTNLTTTDIRPAHSAASKLAGLQYSVGAHESDGSPAHHTITKAIPALFAFDSNIGQGDVLAYYQQFLQDEQTAGRSPEPHLHAICVIGKGYWYLVDGAWVTWQIQYPYHEVLGFLSGILDNYKRVADTRLSPKLSGYIV